MRFPILVASLIAATTVLACSIAGDDASSQESDHTEGRPTYARYKWLWADDTEDEFKANAAASERGSSPEFSPEFLPIDHPMAKRLQFWIDQMDAALRAKVPGALENTPTPRIILRKAPSPNAWVTAIPITWDVGARITRPQPAPAPPPEPGAGDAGALTDAGPPPPPPPRPSSPSFLLVRTGTLQVPGTASALERHADEAMLGEFIRFHNDGFSRCRLSLDQRTVLFGEGCLVRSISTDRADRLGYHATSKWITVTTGLVTSMLDEDRILAVLAHELGHYYRTHGTQPSDQLNYFYALGEGNTAHKPAPDPRYLDHTVKIRDKLRVPNWFEDYSEENKLMTEQVLGFYTTEQEADDISLELLAKIGMPPTLGPDSQLQMQKLVDGRSNGWGDSGEIKWVACAMLRDRGFKDEAGKPVSVPVGDLSDPHHSFCFRTFNMVRELAAHDYEVEGARPTPPGEAFATIVVQMQNDVDRPLPPPDAGEPDAGPADAGAD